MIMKQFCIKVWFGGTNLWYLTDLAEYDISVSKKKYDAAIWVGKEFTEELASVVRSMCEETDRVEVVEY